MTARRIGKNALAVLLFVAGMSAVRQFERHLEHCRQRQIVRDVAALRGPVRRDVISLLSSEKKD